MLRIDLNDYKGSKIYFQLFDIILKDIAIKKEDFLIENDITPSSYRLARKVEQNVGKSIIEKLAKLYNFSIPTYEEIDDIEKHFNQIYLDMYYKIDNDYESHQSYIDNLLSKNYVIFPIIMLFKLFLNANNHIDYERQVSKEEEMYKEILKYKSFLNDSLVEIFMIFEVVYQKNDVSNYMMKNYNNPLVYFILSSKSLGELKYAECLYFIDKCKECLIKENNYKRLIYLYNKLMQCYLYFKNYEECYELAHQVILMCKSFNITGYEANTPEKNLAVSCIALERYDEVVQTYEKKESINSNELCIFLVALYESDKGKYQEAIIKYNQAVSELNNDKLKLLLSIINDYNTKGSKKRLDELKPTIMLTFIKILKERK